MQKKSGLPCVCGNPAPLDACCGRFHSGNELAATAEQLMRARYSAYVLNLNSYLLASWHNSTRPASPDFSDAGNIRWLGLEIKRHTVIDADHAQVEFVARYKIGGQPAVRMLEISHFIRENGRWFYVSGVFPK